MFLNLKKRFNLKAKFKNNLKLNFLRFLYKFFLYRKPNQEDLDKYLKSLENARLKDYKNILINFLYAERFIKIMDLEKSKLFKFNSISEKQLSLLFEKTAFYWRNSASKTKNIYWSVITNKKYKKDLSSSEIKKFLATGKNTVNQIRKICKFIDYDLNNCNNFLDFGCGVGRTLVNLPSHIKKVNFVDFSYSHLEEAEKNIKNHSQINNYSSFLISSFSELNNLPHNQDIIHSFIVLQHNTPPIIEKIVEKLLDILSPFGIAILHIPITKANYKFDISDYLNSEESGKSMEMHILPKANLYKLAKKNNSKIVYSIAANACGGDVYSEFVVFQKNEM